MYAYIHIYVPVKMHVHGSVYACFCIYKHTHPLSLPNTHRRTHVHAHSHTLSLSHTHPNTQTHTQTDTRTRTLTHTHTHSHTHTRVRTCIQSYKQNISSSIIKLKQKTFKHLKRKPKSAATLMRHVVSTDALVLPENRSSGWVMTNWLPFFVRNLAPNISGIPLVIFFQSFFFRVRSTHHKFTHEISF